MLTEALRHLVRGIVEHPDDVHVGRSDHSRGEVPVVHVHHEDPGHMIGRQGRTAKALRTVIAALGGDRRVRVDISND